MPYEPEFIPISDWDSNAKCPKCESSNDDLTVIWNKTGEGVANEIPYTFPDLKEGYPYEHLFMTCKKCGCQWLMETADSEERGKAVDTTTALEKTEKEDLKALEVEGDGVEAIDEVPGSPSGHARRIKGIIHPGI